MFIDAQTYANAGYAAQTPAALSAGNAVGLALSDPTGLALADFNPGTGSWVKASTLAAPTVSLFEDRRACEHRRGHGDESGHRPEHL